MKPGDLVRIKHGTLLCNKRKSVIVQQTSVGLILGIVRTHNFWHGSSPDGAIILWNEENYIVNLNHVDLL